MVSDGISKSIPIGQTGNPNSLTFNFIFPSGPWNNGPTERRREHPVVLVAAVVTAVVTVLILFAYLFGWHL